MCSAGRLIISRPGSSRGPGNMDAPRANAVRTQARPRASTPGLRSAARSRRVRGAFAVAVTLACPRFPSWNLDGEGVDGSSP
jgi:hypothetical protein